nr:5810_t:CDS:2 [Entrophospora candida]
MTITPNNPPKSPLRSIDQESFGYTTATYRWPIIITKTIDDIYKTRYELDPIKDEEKSNEAKEIMNSLGTMKYEMQRKRVLTPIEDDGESDVKSWNDTLNTYFHGENWYSATWLFVECYLYRRMHSAFAKSKHWKNYDPFFRQKEDTFKASFKSVARLAKQAIGPLANEIGVPPILALRTSKADVIVGLPDGLEEHLNNTEKDWMYSGKYAVIQFNEGTK